MMKTLYHVSFDLSDEPNKLFYPRVPKDRDIEEDDKIERVCLSDDIAKCIAAIPDDSRGEFANREAVCINVWKGVFSLEDSNLLGWRYLYESGLNNDAVFTHEYWYLKSVVLSNSLVRVSKIQEAYAHKHIKLFIYPKYKKQVLDIIRSLGIDDSRFEELDACTIVNEWIPLYRPDKTDEVIELVKETIQVPDNEEVVDDEIYKAIYGISRMQVMKPDYLTYMLIDGFEYRYLDLSCIGSNPYCGSPRCSSWWA